MSRNINTIIEGCMPDTPEKLMYCGIELVIPDNASIILSDHDLHPNRFLLYAKSENFFEFEILQNPCFKWSRDSPDPNKLISGGWPIKNFESNFRGIFDAQRSLTTRDGRVYVQAIYFEERWRWYLEAVPAILKECREIFSGEKTEDYFFNCPSSAW